MLSRLPRKAPPHFTLPGSAMAAATTSDTVFQGESLRTIKTSGSNWIRITPLKSARLKFEPVV